MVITSNTRTHIHALSVCAVILTWPLPLGDRMTIWQRREIFKAFNKHEFGCGISLSSNFYVCLCDTRRISQLCIQSVVFTPLSEHHITHVYFHLLPECFLILAKAAAAKSVPHFKVLLERVVNIVNYNIPSVTFYE